MLEVFRTSPSFARVWSGALVSGIGDAITWIALTWFVLERSGSGAAVGAVLLCFALPAALTSAPLGRWMDRAQPRTVMIVDNLARALIVGLFPALDASGQLELWMIFALAVLAGALAPASQVGLRVLVPALVRDDQLEAANTALALAWQIPTVIGPAIAGAIVAAWGAPWALAVDASTFSFMAWMLFGTPRIERFARVESATEASGVRSLLEYPAVVVAVALTLAFYFSYGPLEAALPVFARGALGADAGGYGLLWSALGVGTLLGSLGTARLVRASSLRAILALITLAWGLAQLALGFSPSLGFAMACMFLGGIIWGPYTALEMTLLQRVVPRDLHGRVFGARSALIVPAAPLGTALGGALLGVIPASTVIVVGAIACVLAGAVGLIAARDATIKEPALSEMPD